MTARERDVRGEIIAALGVIVVLAVAITAGILLMTDTPEVDDPEDGTAVAETSVAQVEANTGTPAIIETFTDPAPTDTPEATETDVPDPISSPTAVALQQTSTPSVTHEVAETPVDTATATASLTQAATSTLTATPSATNTPIPPSATMTATPTLTSTVTSSPTATTQVMIVQREELGILPTPTDLPTSTPAPPGSGVPIATCGAPAGWPVYVVQPGNTLFSIARAVGSGVNELAQANCIRDVNAISVGDELSVPRLPVGPVQTGVPSVPTLPAGVPDTGQFAAIGCTQGVARITSPISGQRVTGTFNVMGTAFLDDFQFYKLEIRADNATTYNFYSRSDSPRVDNVLGSIDASLFESGVYYIRLAVVDVTGNVPGRATCVIPVILE